LPTGEKLSFGSGVWAMGTGARLNISRKKLRFLACRVKR
jgi:hypothetical protein